MNQRKEGPRAGERFRWLHLSDIHVGMLDQDWLWPNLKHLLFRDIETLHSQVGPWDLVIFSGDLTQRGAPEEFELFDQIAEELWGVFKRLGFTPKLIVLPGNHDIARAPTLNAELRLLRRWWEEPELPREFFTGANGYRAAVDALLRPYTEWFARDQRTLELVRGKAGTLPGDQSFELTCGNLSVGIVALNSTWLQIDDSDYEGRLHVDVKQLLSVTDNDPYAWCGRHDFNLLVTHHPFSWLHPNSKSFWNSDIDPPGRFDAHLFGHLHKASATSLSTGGSPPRNSIQAPSVFGLMRTADGIERLHGFSVGQAEKTDRTREIKLWPRALLTLQSGGRKLGADQTFDLDIDNSATIFSSRDGVRTSDRAEKTVRHDISLRTIANESRDALAKVQYKLPSVGAHANVRKLEQRRLTQSLTEDRASWLVSDWGMDRDAFVASARQLKAGIDRPVYRIDAATYKSRAQFLEGIRDVLDCSFQQLCELMSRSGESLLLLDDFPSEGSDEERSSIARDLEDLVKVLLEYCPSLSVVISCRRVPVGHALPLVHIKALDEADLRTYVLEHWRGGSTLVSPISIGLLLRHTDGIPARIDQTLKELEVVPLSELLNTDSDIAVAPPPAGASPSVAKSVRALAESGDSGNQRAYGLLKVLSLFPQGEQLGRIKRFYLNQPFFPQHATQLLDLALIDVMAVQGLESGVAGAVAKTLVVPRPVRECIRDLMDVEEAIRLNHRAAEIYFGQQWLGGVFKFPNQYKFDDPHCGNAEIVNANTIVLRLLREELAKGSSNNVDRVLALADFYLQALANGSHYNNGVIFCEDLVPTIPPSGFKDKLASVKGRQAQCLRMLGEHGRAKSILLEIADHSFSNSRKQSVFIDLALCLQSLNEDNEAGRVAKQIVELDMHSHYGLQARALLIELADDDPDRSEKLVKMEKLCRKEGANVVANNIALKRAGEVRDNPDQVREILEPVVKAQKDSSDYYNRTRATLRLAKQSLDAGETLNEADLSYLVSAYHFLFNERLANMFDQCHGSLWKSFEQSHETDNLLTLFRHSSLYWRLQGRDTKELPYLKRLRRMIGESIAQRRLSNLSREAEYYLTRAANQPQVPQSSFAQLPKSG